MNFFELCELRQSCRSYDPTKEVEREKLDLILSAARLSPSACNGQPYLITVCEGEAKKEVARAVMGMGMNKFAKDAPILLVISEEDYVASAALGAKLKNNDYRSMDVGILAATLTYAAAELGLGSCILGWLDDGRIRSVCGLSKPLLSDIRRRAISFAQKSARTYPILLNLRRIKNDKRWNESTRFLPCR